MPDLTLDLEAIRKRVGDPRVGAWRRNEDVIVLLSALAAAEERADNALSEAGAADARAEEATARAETAEERADRAEREAARLSDVCGLQILTLDEDESASMQTALRDRAEAIKKQMEEDYYHNIDADGRRCTALLVRLELLDQYRTLWPQAAPAEARLAALSRPGAEEVARELLNKIRERLPDGDFTMMWTDAEEVIATALRARDAARKRTIWRPMDSAPKDKTDIWIPLAIPAVQAYWDDELRTWVLTRPLHVESICQPLGWLPTMPARAAKETDHVE